MSTTRPGTLLKHQGAGPEGTPDRGQSGLMVRQSGLMVRDFPQHGHQERVVEPLWDGRTSRSANRDLASLHTGAFAFEESPGVQSPTGEAMPAEQLAAMFSDYLRSLPAEQFPHLRRAAEVLFAGNLHERCEFGLELIVRGVQTYVRSAPSEPLR